MLVHPKSVPGHVSRFKFDVTYKDIILGAFHLLELVGQIGQFTNLKGRSHNSSLNFFIMAHTIFEICGNFEELVELARQNDTFHLPTDRSNLTNGESPYLH